MHGFYSVEIYRDKYSPDHNIVYFRAKRNAELFAEFVEDEYIGYRAEVLEHSVLFGDYYTQMPVSEFRGIMKEMV